MQEEVNQRTMALSIRASKLTGKVLAAAFSKVVRAAKAHHQKALTPKGRQSVAKLMNHYGAKNYMPYVGAPKDFDRIAKEFHVDYAFHKVSPGHYLLFSRPGRRTPSRRPSRSTAKRCSIRAKNSPPSSASFGNSRSLSRRSRRRSSAPERR